MRQYLILIFPLTILLGLMCSPYGGKNFVSDDLKKGKTETAGQSKDSENQTEKACGPALIFKMRRLAGSEESLCDYQGKVIMIVNTASECGFTYQYKDLQKLYDTYKNRNFTILGFPANDFLSQEPGSDKEIAAFCEMNYGVTFPMFSKISVKGEEKAPLYEYLTEKIETQELQGEINWNFQKYIVNPYGEVVAKFAPKTEPMDPLIIETLEKLVSPPKNTEENPK